MRIGKLEISWNARRRDPNIEEVWFKGVVGPIRLGDLTPSQLREELATIKEEIEDGKRFTIGKKQRIQVSPTYIKE